MWGHCAAQVGLMAKHDAHVYQNNSEMWSVYHLTWALVRKNLVILGYPKTYNSFLEVSTAKKNTPKLAF
jgi:hypothetical protein|tara:strand:+ start:497 stop:703 length:207 start_codon:yes stop_codon:yes gene_type:complete